MWKGWKGRSIQVLQVLVPNSSQGPQRAYHGLRVKPPYLTMNSLFLPHSNSVSYTHTQAHVHTQILSDTEGVCLSFSCLQREKKGHLRERLSMQRKRIIDRDILRGEWKIGDLEHKEEGHFPLR